MINVTRSSVDHSVYFGTACVVAEDSTSPGIVRLVDQLVSASLRHRIISGSVGDDKGARNSLHRAALESAWEEGVERVLIVEDDAIFRDDLGAWLSRLRPQLELVLWDLCYLCVAANKSDGMCAQDLGTVREGHCFTAYVAARKAIPRILRCLEYCGTGERDLDDPHLVRIYTIPPLAIPDPDNGPFPEIDRALKLFDVDEFVANCKQLRGARSVSHLKRVYLREVETADDDTLVKIAGDHKDAGRIAEAEHIYGAILARNPSHVGALGAYAMLADVAGNKVQAIELLCRAQAASPASAEIKNNLGAIVCRLGKSLEALRILDEALNLSPGLPQAHYNRARALDQLGRVHEAIESLRKALELRPHYPEAGALLGECLIHVNEGAEGIKILRAVFDGNTDFAEVCIPLARALLDSGQPEEALTVAERGARLRPESGVYHGMLGAALGHCGLHERASRVQRYAADLTPMEPGVRYNYALSLLRGGNLSHGWREYEWRRLLDTHEWRQRRFFQPEWCGVPLAGQAILVVSEQGFGDTIQFARYVPLLADLGAKVFFEVPRPLIPLMRSLRGVHRLISFGDSSHGADLHVRLMTLPAMMDTTLESVPAAIPYLDVDQSRVLQWKPRIVGELKVGLAWQGHPGYKEDRFRSVSLNCLEPLAALEGITLYSLQKGYGASQVDEVTFAVKSFCGIDEYGAFLDTAAIMRNLDLVITTDTSIAHLAGALGVPVWVALPYSPDWRWFLGREDSPWYPTMQLFRQSKGGEWTPVFRRMACALSEKSKGHDIARR